MKFPRILYWLVCLFPIFAACTSIKMGGLFNPCDGPDCPTPTATRKPLATIIAIKPAVSSSPEIKNRPFTPDPGPTVTPAAPNQPVLSPGQATRSTLTPQASPTPGPGVLSRLIYLSKGSLLVWDRVTNKKTLIAANVTQFSVSENGKRLVYLQNKRVSANAEQLYELYRFDLLNEVSTQLLSETHQIYHLTLSPDGRYLAYTTRADGGEVATLQVDRINPASITGRCEADQSHQCQELLWAPDSQALLWNDQQGVWFSYLTVGKAKLISPVKIEIIDPKGKKSPVSISYFNSAWSPVGRYVLLQVGVRDSNVMWDAVLDSRNGRLSPVPGTYNHQALHSQSGWLQDGSVYVAQAAEGQDRPLPSIQIWRVAPTSKDVLTFIRQVEVKPVETDGTPPYQQLFVLPGSSCPLSDHFLVIGLSPIESDFPPGIFGLDIESGETRQVISLPYDISRIIWSPDLSGAILLGWHQQVLFAAMDGSGMKDLRTNVGSDAQQFAWIPVNP